MTKRNTIVSLFISAALSLATCARSKPQVTVGKSDAITASGSAAQEPGDVSEQIVSALQRRRYADAAVLARRAKISKPESDFAVGEIILQGHTDDSAAQTPRENIEEGLELIEAAALAGHQQAVSALAATFHTGLFRRTVDACLLKPDAALSLCWEHAKTKPQMARSCIHMRRKY
jgi:hypothetical protein